ncbi:MAG TPA: hypothetical protein VIJ94_05505 [Caulobacteraceae bacterium]
MGKVVLPKAAVEQLLGLIPSPQLSEVKPVKPVDQPPATDQPDLRLIIEEAEEYGGLMYIIVDRRTGKVVSRLSREQVLRLREKANYAAGAVFDGKA